MCTEHAQPDGDELARPMFGHNVVVADAARPYVVQRVDVDFLEAA
jgi:hypothetical protein